MSWGVLVALVLTCGLALAVALARRAELRRMEQRVRDRARAVRSGSHEAQLQHPVVDLSRCLGCATCVAVCPEDGVLDIVHGQAVVVNGARCAGVSACERECPAGAITVTLANLESRNDVPALTDTLEADGARGLFLAGEVTAHALIRTAVEHGTAVAREVAARVSASSMPGAIPSSPARSALSRALAAPPFGPQASAPDRAPAPADEAGARDLLIAGAGPAGLACALEARRMGLDFAVIDQASEPGGTVAKYPRHKLVLVQPVDLPLVGRLARRTWAKEELMEVWRDAVGRAELPIRFGVTLEGLEREDGGDGVVWVARTDAGPFRARNVCLALGRRGSPRRLGVPGEELAKVAYGLTDARSYQGRRVLVVGGGDSAVETALALARQPDNQVVLSYRRPDFVRIRARNQERLEAARADGSVEVLNESRVLAIKPDAVELEVRGERRSIPNDDVFVQAGGTPPFEMLRRAGVSFDPRSRPAQRVACGAASGLVPALGTGFLLACAALIWTLANSDYYLLSMAERPTHPKHAWLRPGLGLGLWMGIAALLLVAVNLLYLARRSPRVRLAYGSLRAWMTSHVVTGILAFLCALLHSAMAPRDTVGGHALWALLVLLGTGAIGRYFYAWVPRAANGRELELDEVKARIERFSGGDAEFEGLVRDEVQRLIHRRQWRGSFAGRALALLGFQLDLGRALSRLEREARSRGVSAADRARSRALAREAHRKALLVAHLEDLRALLNTWRWVHRWAALLMSVLLFLHIASALAFGAHFFERAAG